MPIATLLRKGFRDLKISRLPLGQLLPVANGTFPPIQAVPATDDGIVAVLVPALAMAPPVVEPDGDEQWRVVANAKTVALFRACVPPVEWPGFRIPCLRWDGNKPAGLVQEHVGAALDVMLGDATDLAGRQTRRVLRKEAGIRLSQPVFDAMAYLTATHRG